jgi:hypothetical protein
MTGFSKRPAVKVAFLLAILAVPAPAFAALGGDSASVAEDLKALHGTLTVATAPAYQIHELALASGGVREYVAPSGTVFAVTWNARKAPDLRQLLGSYFERYAAEARVHRTGHHLLSIDTPDFVASAVLSQRGSRGRAILRALVPGGVTNEELR